MKIRDCVVSVLGALLLMGCPSTCRDQMKIITLINETNDSLCVSLWHHYPPSLDTVPPLSKYICEGVYTDQIDYHDFRAFITTLGTVKKYGMESVLRFGLYDTILHLSRDELEVKQYIVKINRIKMKDFSAQLQ